MSGHTPGPWTFVPQRDDPEGAPVTDLGGFRGPNGESICTFGENMEFYPDCGTPPSEADARLIAAAPDLLEAVRGFLSHVPMFTPQAELDAKREAVRAIGRAAIAKAEGK